MFKRFGPETRRHTKRQTQPPNYAVMAYYELPVQKTWEVSNWGEQRDGPCHALPHNYASIGYERVGSGGCLRLVGKKKNKISILNHGSVVIIL